MLSVRPKLKLYLFPLTRLTLKNCPYPKILLQFFIQDYFFLLLLITDRQKCHVLEGYIKLLSDNSFNDSLLGKYYFCSQALAICEQLKTNFNLYKT